MTLPNAEQVQRHLATHPVTAPSRLLAWLPLAMLVVVLMLTATVEHGPATLLPWLLLAGFLGHHAWRAARLRGLEQRVGQAQEFAALRRHREALRLAWRLLPAVRAMPEAWHRMVALIGHNLDQMRAYDAAIVAYDHLLERLPQEHPAAVHVAVQRAIAQLASERLLDADTSLRRLRDLAEGGPPSLASAAYRFAVLFQASRTNRDADVITRADRLVEELRPLGVDAGAGYALAALAFHRLARRDPEQAPALLDGARLWWSRATLLIALPTLLERYPDLRDLASDPAVIPAAQPATPPG